MDALLSLFVATAVAGSGAKPPPVDFSRVPASAAKRGPDNAGKPHPVLARLLVDSASLPAGGTARLGVHLTQDEGWHTYWKSPGDIGLPTVIAWQGPPGVSIAEHRFPVPERFQQDGQTSWGYDHEVLLISDVTVPAGTPPGRHTIAADVDWLVCLTSCIPGKVHLELPVEVTAGAAQPSEFRPLFERYEDRMPLDPERLDAFTWDLRVEPDPVPAKGKFRATWELTTKGPALGEPLFAPLVPADYEWGVASLTHERKPDGRVLVVLEAETYDPDPVPTDAVIGGLVQIDAGGKRVAVELVEPLKFAPKEGAATVAAPPAPVRAEPAQVVVPSSAAPIGSGAVSLVGALLFAVLGGLVLNVMPCVLPVLTLKLYGLVEQTDITAGQRRAAGLAYTAGVLASFGALAAAIIVLRTVFGVEVDWGFQFQYPPYVAALATVVFAFGLSLLGVFEIPALGADAADRASSREGLAGTFLTGVFATLLATPCSAPFLGSAVAYAFAAPAPELFAIFTAVGFGLALPFLLVAFVPALFRFLPRPGEWMDAFKQLLGFTLVATTVWLVDVLLAQIGPDGTVGFLAFLTCVAVGAWVFGKWGGVAESPRRQLGALVAAALISVSGGVYFLDLKLAEAADCDTGEVKTELAWDGEIPWQAFTDQRVEALAGTIVFVDFTADWCLTCKVNERTILETAVVKQEMQRLGVVPLKADWTRRDEAITRWLRAHGRAGVPMYLVLPADRTKAPIVLPEVITPSMVTDALRQAADSRS